MDGYPHVIDSETAHYVAFPAQGNDRGAELALTLVPIAFAAIGILVLLRVT